MILEYLQQNELIPLGAKPEAVRDLKYVLMARLLAHLHKQYHWFAIRDSAIRAGMWGGNRRVNQRLKLRRLIQVCCEYLNEPDPTAHFKDGWERQGLYYGNGAERQFVKDFDRHEQAAPLFRQLRRDLGITG